MNRPGPKSRYHLAPRIEIKRHENNDELVVHINSLTGRISAGYISQDGTKVSRSMTAIEIGQKIIEEPLIKIKFMMI